MTFSVISSWLRKHPVALLLLLFMGISFFHIGLANADYASIPKQKLGIDPYTGLYDEAVNLNAGTNNPWTGAGAAVPDSYFKLYTNSPGGTRTINIYITQIDNSRGACAGYAIDPQFIQPDRNGNIPGRFPQ